MTEDEKRQQKAMLLLEYQEAEQTLAHLQEKARHRVQSLTCIAQWLTKSYDGTWNFDPSQEIYSSGAHTKILDDPRYEVAMDFAAVKTIALEIKDCMDNLRALQKRKQELGLK